VPLVDRFKNAYSEYLSHSGILILGRVIHRIMREEEVLVKYNKKHRYTHFIFDEAFLSQEKFGVIIEENL